MAQIVASPVFLEAFPEADLSLPNGGASPFLLRLAETLAAHPFVGQQLRDAEGIAVDLDYTLIESRPGFEALNNEIGRRSGVVNLGLISEMDARMRGQPLDVYLSAFYDVCIANGMPELSWPEFLRIRERTMEELAAGRIEIPGGISQVPDSFILLATLERAWQKVPRVFTHCPRLLAAAFIREAGFSQLVDCSTMVCGDDTSLGKDTEEYWRRIVSFKSAPKWVGFDDTSIGAEWMLRRAGFGLVIVRPSSSSYLDRLSTLQKEFGERLFVLQEFGELFAFVG